MTTIIGPTIPEPYFGEVESIWDELHDEFGIDLYPNPFPHVTLYALPEGVDTATIESALRTVCTDHDPFSLHTDGIGVFPGNHVWIPVARSSPLTALHRDVVDAISEIGTAPTAYYEPHRWFPHIGLALNLDDELTTATVRYLLDRDFEWEFPVDNVTVTRPPANESIHEIVATVEL